MSRVLRIAKTRGRTFEEIEASHDPEPPAPGAPLLIEEHLAELRAPRAAKRSKVARKAPRPRRTAAAPRRGMVEPLTFTPAEDALWTKLEALGVQRPRRDETGETHYPGFIGSGQGWQLWPAGDVAATLPARFKSWDAYAAAGLVDAPVFLPHVVAKREAR